MRDAIVVSKAFSLPALGISIVPVTEEHASSLASYVQRNCAHLEAFLPAVATLTSEATASEHLRRACERMREGEMLEWHLFLHDALCGSIRLKEIDMTDRKAQIGYWLGAECQGRGIITASVRAILGYGFGTLGLHRVELRCAVDNAGSIGVARRLGFTLEGTLRQYELRNGQYADQHVYGLLFNEFTGSETDAG